MAQFIFDWNDGTQDQIVIEGNPQGSGPVTIKSVNNLGVDRTKKVTFKTTDNKHQASLTINQSGLREQFNCTDGVFQVSEGDFLVFKSTSVVNGSIVLVNDKNEVTGLSRKSQKDYVRY